MTTLKTTKINIQDLKPAEYNPRIMPEAEQEKLKLGLTTFGLVDPIIIDLTDNNTVIGGHQRLDVLKQLNPDEELTLIKLGDIGLVIKETDLKIKDKNDQKALNLALNKIQGTWDNQKLDNLLIDLKTDYYNIELTGFDKTELLDLENNILSENNEDNAETEIQSDNKYSQKVETPVYTPSEKQPPLTALYDTTKRDELVQEIKQADIADPIKQFLINASNRHIKYHYDKIADYYAHAPAEVQQLIENNALVVIDYEKAIEDGYFQLIRQLDDEVEKQ